MLQIPPDELAKKGIQPLLNEQQKAHFAELVMAQSYAFDGLLEGLGNLKHPEAKRLLNQAMQIHEIHEKIGVSLGILH